MSPPPLLGDALDETLGDTLAETLAEGEAEIDAEGVGDTDADGVGDGEADGLLMISRTAKWTIARSSDVPDDMPTDRLPCPAVVSTTPTKH